MPIVRVTQSTKQNRSTKSRLPSYLPVLQAPALPQPDELFYEEEMFDQTLYTQNMYDYQATTAMIPDQNVLLTTTYYSNQPSIHHPYTNHRTFQHHNPSHTSYMYYNR